MDRQKPLLWALQQCDELVNGYLTVNHADWFDIDRATLVGRWNESDQMFTFILCMRKTGSDIIILDQSRQIDEVIADINRNLISLRNDEFHIINPFFKGDSKVSSLKALSWAMYVFKHKYHSLQFEADGSLKVIF